MRSHTPEEQRWLASILDPAKARRNLKWQSLFAIIWLLIFIGWITYTILEGFDLRSFGFILVFLFNFAAIYSGIRRNKRILRGDNPFNPK